MNENVFLNDRVVENYRDAVVQKVEEALSRYGEYNHICTGVRPGGVSHNMETAEVTVWIKGIGLCRNYRSLTTSLEEALPNCDVCVGDGLYGDDKTTTKRAVISPKSVLLEQLKEQSSKRVTINPPGPQKIKKVGGGTKNKICGGVSAGATLVFLLAVLVAAFVFIFSYVQTISALKLTEPDE